MKLNLASGTDLKDGWINLDIVPKWPSATRGCEVIWDARKDLIPFPDSSVEEVYAGYLLLHLAPQHHARVLADIHRVMRREGRLVVGEVDMRVVMTRWMADPFNKNLSELIWGEQGDFHGADLAEFDKHCWGFTEDKLREFLHLSGFDRIGRINIHHPDVFYELTLECFKH